MSAAANDPQPQDRPACAYRETVLLRPCIYRVAAHGRRYCAAHAHLERREAA